VTLQRWIDRGLRWWTVGVYLFLFLPILVVIVFSFNDGRNVTQITGFSMRWYEEAWTDQFVVRALRTSLTIALVSAVIATIIGTLSAIAMNGARPAVRLTFEVLIYIAIIVPGIVIGISTLIFAVTAFDLVNPVLASLLPGDPPQLSLGLGTVIAAHAMFTSAIVNVLVRTRMAGMDRALIEASSDLYASPWRTFRQVTIPQLRPAIVAGFLLAFTFSFDDFIVAFFTTGQDQTLPIFLFASIRRGVTPVVNAIATVLLTVTISSLVLAWFVAGRRRRSAAPSAVPTPAVAPEVSATAGP
jgi:spermidine/putrescine transport system permease protein